MSEYIELASNSGIDRSVSTQSLVSLFIDPEVVLSFLNTSQTGSAHQAYGTELSVLVKHLLTAFCICFIEISLFCYLRNTFKHIYQPRRYHTSEDEELDDSPSGFFAWVIPAWKNDISQFLSTGLDTYFFLRFINILLIFFVTCGAFNMIVLLPVNSTGSSEAYRANGLDILSISNIAKSKVKRLNFHFFCSLITIAVFNLFIFYEFRNITQIRHAYLHSYAHRRKKSSRVLLLGNVPESERDSRTLQKLFGLFNGGLQNVWLVDNYHQYRWLQKQGEEALDLLEATQVSRMKILNGIGYRPQDDKCLLFHPPIYFKAFRIPLIDLVATIRLPGLARALTLQKKVPVIDWCVITLAFVHRSLTQRIDDISAEQFVKLDKAFLMFNTSEAAYMAHQTLLSSSYGKFDKSIVELHPKNIIWANVARASSIVAVMERHLVHIIIIIFIGLYIVPVSLVTLFSQVAFITQLLPCMGFLNKLPAEIKMAITSLTPAVLLTVVTAIQLKIFRFLLSWKGNWTESDLELDIQRWYFAFLFVQQFLVVSVSSSLTSIVVQIVEKPVSIPLLLASNIPKSSTFFCKYLSIKALGLCGNNFLRVTDLFSHLFVHTWIDKTPRKKLRRLTDLRRVRWGSIYSTFSVYGAIGLTFSTISPIVSLFMIVILLLTLLYYKHALRFMYSRTNEYDSRGKLYPRALFQLYAGVYCLEFCMIGIFIAQKDSRGEFPMKYQAVGMALASISTIFGNIVAYNRFKKLFNYFPQIHDGPPSLEEDHLGHDEELVEETLMYHHPCYQYEKPKVWLPEDPLGKCKELLADLTVFTSAISGGTTEGSMLVKEGPFHRLNIVLPSHFEQR